MTGYDFTTMDRLGEQRETLRAQLAAIVKALDVEIERAHAAGEQQANIARHARMSRENIKAKTDPAARHRRRPDDLRPNPTGSTVGQDAPPSPRSPQ